MKTFLKIWRNIKISNFVFLSCFLYLIWILLSGKFELKFLLIGAVSSLIISFIFLPFLTVKGFGSDKRYFLFSLNYSYLLIYALWLCKEILASSWSATKEIFKSNDQHNPRVIYFSMPFENPMAHVFLANSITITPGTITVDILEGGIYEVHAINKDAADGVMGGEMAARVARLFDEKCVFTPLPELENRNIIEEEF